MIKSCETCRSESFRKNVPPCHGCDSGYSNWEPKLNTDEVFCQSRFDRLEKRIEELEEKIETLEKSIHHVAKTIDNIIKYLKVKNE